MLRIPKSSIVSAIVLTAMVAACAPTAVQLPVDNQRAKVVGTNASTINSALATMAGQTTASLADYRVGAEDLLQITLFNVSDADSRVMPRTTAVRVSQQGFVSLPLIGDVKVAGRTASELERELKTLYDKYIYSPQVGVLVAEYRQRVSVIGAVQKTGSFELTGPKTVIDILGMAGGVSERAGTQVHIYRQGPNGRESYVIDLLTLASNASLITADNAGLITMPVQSGDVINVPLAGMFFVDGAIRSPGAYPLGRRYSLSQALATAGGVNRDLNASDITIFRRKTASGVETINVDLDSMIAGSATDPEIEADDVIMVPISSAKYVYHRIFGQILGWGTSIAGVAAVR